MAYKYATIDIESTGLDRYHDHITYIGVGLARSLDEPLCKKRIFNVWHENTDADEVVDKFRSLCSKLKEHGVRLIWQNGKFDSLFIEHHYGIKLPIHDDVMVMGTAYELAESHALDTMAERYLNMPSWDIPLREKKKPNNPKVEPYLEQDLDAPWELYRFFRGVMEPKHVKVYRKLLLPAYRMYLRAECHGIWFDREGLRVVKKTYHQQQREKLAVLKKRHDINWNSPDQVSTVLFKKEKLPVLAISEKTGKPSGNAKVLRRLASKGHDLPTKLLEYKFYYGANTKFLNSWDRYAETDHRIHPSFKLTNVVTGRTSCSDPNLQQVPRNPELRQLYSAPDGFSLIEADYSQIELRVAADYANEPTMISIYNEGGDIHTETASSVSGVPLEKVTKDERGKAKAVNFGFIYGMGAKGFINYAFDSYGVVFADPEAQLYRELFFKKYSRLPEWHKEMEELCMCLGGVENRFGRFRALPNIYSSDRKLRSGAVRRAINTPVQGTASDILLCAAMEIDHVLRPEMNLRIVGTVHDSILMECPDEYLKPAQKEIKRIMRHPQGLDVFGVSFKVPIEADIGVGPWGSK